MYKRTFINIKDTSHLNCINDKNILNNDIKVLNRIGTKSVFGQVFKACYPLNCKNNIAIKRIFFKFDSKYLKDKLKDKNDIFRQDIINSSNEVFLELFFIEMCTELVKKRICPFLPMYFNYNICNNCEDVKHIKDIMSNVDSLDLTYNSCMYIENELADGDLKSIVNSSEDYYELLSAYYQIFIALFTLKTKFNFHHNDLHYGNVLFHKLKKGNNTQWKFTINNKFLKKEIYVPVKDKIFVLWDFGKSFIPSKIIPYRFNGSSKYFKTNHYKDFDRIISMLDVTDSEKKSYNLSDKNVDIRKKLHSQFKELLDTAFKSKTSTTTTTKKSTTSTKITVKTVSSSNNSINDTSILHIYRFIDLLPDIGNANEKNEYIFNLSKKYTSNIKLINKLKID